MKDYTLYPKDTAEEVAPIQDLLHSMANRVQIASLLIEQGRGDLLATVLEDIFYGAQLMLEDCIKHE